MWGGLCLLNLVKRLSQMLTNLSLVKSIYSLIFMDAYYSCSWIKFTLNYFLFSTAMNNNWIILNQFIIVKYRDYLWIYHYREAKAKLKFCKIHSQTSILHLHIQKLGSHIMNSYVVNWKSWDLVYAKIWAVTLCILLNKCHLSTLILIIIWVRTSHCFRLNHCFVFAYIQRLLF